MSIVRILHLSDLHYESTREADFRILLEALFDDIRELNSALGPPDLVAFSGDLISSGDYGYSEGRSDYEKAIEVFVSPLLETAGVPPSRLYVCPGNHDVERGKINEFVEAGLSEKLVDRDALNDFVDEVGSHPEVFARLEAFNRFRASLELALPTSSTPLAETYELALDETTLGIACVNTAWRAVGGDGDYGRLLIGERTIDSCIDALKDCAIRVGVAHHPLEYLMLHDQASIKRRIYGGFNFWLSGHTHDPEVILVQQFNEGRLLHVSGGALYHTRDYFNGYSLIEFDTEAERVKVHLREYIDRDRGFHPALAYEEDDGVVEVVFPRGATKPIDVDLPLIEALRARAEMDATNALLPTAVRQSRAPKDPVLLYVDPPLSRKPEYTGGHDADILTTREVCLADENFLIVGRKESGKTTFLQQIRLFHLSPERMPTARLPLYVDFEDLPGGKNAILNSIRNSVRECGIAEDASAVLVSRRCLILVDNLDTGRVKAIRQLAEFITAYPEHRYLMTADIDLVEAIRPEDFGVDGFAFGTLYIHTFGRKQIRELAKTWYAETLPAIDPGELADNIQAQISQINLPPNPYIVSMMLLIIEQQSDYQPYNKAALVSDFIRLLVEQVFGREVAAGGIDYRNIEDFLSHMAKTMFDRSCTRLPADEFLGLAQEYFSRRGLPLPAGSDAIVHLLVSRGILLDDGAHIEFRVLSFYEFFIAKVMQENVEFESEILAGDNLLSFANSVEFLTGLVRKNRNVLDLLYERAELSWQAVLTEFNLPEIDLASFDNLVMGPSVIDDIDETDRHAFVEKLRQSRLSEETKDTISDIVYRRAISLPEVSSSEENPFDVVARLFQVLELFAVCVRNCELIDDVGYRRANLRACLVSAVRLLYFLYIASEGALESFDPSEVSSLRERLLEQMDRKVELSNHELEEILGVVRWLLRVFPAVMLQALFSEWIGSPKLAFVLREDIEDSGTPSPVKLIETLVYADLRLPGFADYVAKLTRELLDNRLYRELIYVRMRYIYSVKELSSQQRQAVENILAGIVIKNEQRPPKDKAAIVRELRSREGKPR